MASTIELIKVAKKSDADLILDVASELENLTKETAEELARELANNEGHNEFRLGGVFSVIKSNGWYDGYKDFKAYISEKYGIEYRKAMYCINIYDKLVSEQIPWGKVSELGWTKLSILVPVITAENVDTWVAKALEVNCETLKALVKASTQGLEKVEDETKVTSEVVKMAFTVHPDQKETISQALEKAKAEVNTEFSTVALESICLGYLGDVVAVPKGKSLKELMATAGFEKVLEEFQTLWPNISLTVDLPDEVVA